MSTILTRLEQLEATVTYVTPPPPGQTSFRYVPGRLPVVVSAPHGAAHRRDGRDKSEDEYTAALARLVAERTGAHVLYAWARSDDDPNWNTDSPYKEALRRIAAEQDIRFVLDLHGMGDRHKFGVAVGTMCGASCGRNHEALIMTTLAEAGFTPATAPEASGFPVLRQDRYVLNHPRFTGGLTGHTVTRFAVEHLGIHAAQIELCAGLRIVSRRATHGMRRQYRGNPQGIIGTVAMLETLVARLAELSA